MYKSQALEGWGGGQDYQSTDGSGNQASEKNLGGKHD